MDDPARHRFIVVIPVAERPRMLENCIRSLIDHLKRSPYGAPHPTPVSVLIVDDSASTDSVATHRQIAFTSSSEGVLTEYLGLEEQGALLSCLSPDDRHALGRIVGTYNDGPLPGHKGASVCRNLAMLHLAKKSLDTDRTLIWFVDSDEEFTSLEDDGSGIDIPYFHELDRLFSETSAEVVTGKVFGDPPVAPAVMIGGLLEDLEAFLLAISRMNPNDPCAFHDSLERQTHDAAYNDLRKLFGFSETSGPFPYRCPLGGTHTVSDALVSFASTLPTFFHGRHPTRRISASSETSGAIAPARTVYTGNFVIRPSALRYFIPFAPLKLRMAGPVLGRLLRTRIGDRFLSAPLPLRHRRVLPGEAVSEFRAGMKGSELGLNLSREFEAQFWGDVMLFTMEALIRQGYPATMPDLTDMGVVLAATSRDLYGRYETNRNIVSHRCGKILHLLSTELGAWNMSPLCSNSLMNIKSIVHSVKTQFVNLTIPKSSSPGAETIDFRVKHLTDALSRYLEDEQIWNASLSVRS